VLRAQNIVSPTSLRYVRIGLPNFHVILSSIEEVGEGEIANRGLVVFKKPVYDLPILHLLQFARLGFYFPPQTDEYQIYGLDENVVRL
jgi:hypothetical protein